MSAIIGTESRFSLDLSYSMFDLQASLQSSVYLLSRDLKSAHVTDASRCILYTERKNATLVLASNNGRVFENDIFAPSKAQSIFFYQIVIYQ